MNTEMVTLNSTGVAVCQKCHHWGPCSYITIKGLGGELILCDLCIALLTIKALEMSQKRGKVNP